MAGRNIYFRLTEELNAGRRVAVLASGQAVVHYRLAIMSKDGDWILEETDEACARVLEVLSARGARYRPGAPLDVRWLAGGWSSHFEFEDRRDRRIRCDFFTRPPRIPRTVLADLFLAPRTGEADVIGIEPLIRMKQTQRAKDYPVIGELARRLPPEKEIELTTDPDRILELAARYGAGCARPCVRAALAGEGRRAVVVGLAEEIDAMQQRDRQRAARYQRASRAYLRAFRRLDRADLMLPESHRRVCELGERWLPASIEENDGDADAQ